LFDTQTLLPDGREMPRLILGRAGKIYSYISPIIPLNFTGRGVRNFAWIFNISRIWRFSVSSRNILSAVKNWPWISALGDEMGLKCKISFSGPPKVHVCENYAIWHTNRKNRCSREGVGLGCRVLEEPQNWPRHLVRILGEKNRIVMKFCTGVEVPDIITHANLVTISLGIWG